MYMMEVKEIPLGEERDWYTEWLHIQTQPGNARLLSKLSSVWVWIVIHYIICVISITELLSSLYLTIADMLIVVILLD